MRHRRLSTISAALTAAVLVGATAALAGSGSGHGQFRPPPDSLRALAAPIGLRIGTAVTPFELDHPDYAQITGDQFSSVTPGNEMKWQVVEPTRGTYDWSGGDRLVRLAPPHQHPRPGATP